MACKLARQVEIVTIPVKNEHDFHPKCEVLLVWSSAKRLYSQVHN